MKATEVGRLVEQLKQVHEGRAWHGPSVGEALDGVSALSATERPIIGAHSIWEIVHHLRVVAEAVRTHLAGEVAAEEADWPAVRRGHGDAGDMAWRAAVARLEATQRALRDAAATFPEARLHENIPGKSHSYWYELLGVLHHDVYHAGQISLLKLAHRSLRR
jgi:uncharacterized damage-inducible protein DinB